jgi:hypothetical protein
MAIKIMGTLEYLHWDGEFYNHAGDGGANHEENIIQVYGTLQLEIKGGKFPCIVVTLAADMLT